MAEENPKVGRPSKYDPAMCEQVVEFGRQGMGKAEIAFELAVCRDTVNEWARQHPDFSDAIRRATDFAAGWWATQGRTGIRDRNFNAQAYRLQVLNRFPSDWRDKQSLEHTGADGGPVVVAVTRRVVDPTNTGD